MLHSGNRLDLTGEDDTIFINYASHRAHLSSISNLRVRRVTLHDATLTVSNDQSPYFQSSPLPLPVAVPEACRLARIPAMGSQASPTAPAPPPALLPVNGDFPRRSLLVPCWPETGFKEMTLSICVRQLCKFAIDVVPRLCFGANLVVIVTPPRGTCKAVFYFKQCNVE
ncbi:hypothetical protein T01_7012, partial [Trichinella spiralis]